MAISIQEFLQLRKEKSIVDVRSENEFAAGHIPGAINVPILNNEERTIVGTTYKKQGQQLAIEEGFRLVGPRLYDLIKKTEEIAQGREILVHCWRGGMRSNNFCQFVNMAGVRTQALQGGYKSYRTSAHEAFQFPFKFILIGGCTGSGKSEVLRELKKQGEQVIDLEDLANHKGSAFGGLLMPPQPTTEQFENNLFEEILKIDLHRRIWIEDESIAIGKIFLPHPLWDTMVKAPLVNLELQKEKRVDRLVNEYGGADPEQFLKAMSQIVRKLGGQNYNEAKLKYEEGDMAGSIEILLTYYDKAYRSALEKRSERILKTMEWDGKNANLAAEELIKWNK